LRWARTDGYDGGDHAGSLGPGLNGLDPSGSILMWETDEPVPTRNAAIAQDTSAFIGRKLLLDGQQRLTSLTAVINGEPVHVRGRKKPIDILFNLEHPDGPPTDVTEVEGDENSPISADDEEEGESDNDDAPEGEALQQKLGRRAFVVSSKALLAQPNWILVSEVFGNSNDGQLLQKVGVRSFDDPRYQRYSDRLKKLRSIRDYSYVVHVLERAMSYEEVTEIFVRVNSLGAKLRSSDLALAQMTSRWPNLLGELEAFLPNLFRPQFGVLPPGGQALVDGHLLFSSVPVHEEQRVHTHDHLDSRGIFRVYFDGIDELAYSLK